MHEVDKLARNFVGNDDTIEIYDNFPSKRKYAPKIAEIVNKFIPKIDNSHSSHNEQMLKSEGYITIKNFLSKSEIDEFKNIVNGLEGYNAHCPHHSDVVPRKYNENYEFNTCSYYPHEFLKNKLFLKLATDPETLSLVQSYLGCFPTIYSINSWWHKFNGTVYDTQIFHRDTDDFKFLCFFLYLTDVDDENGPHVYCPKSHINMPLQQPKSIKGKAGTLIIADTFSMHKGNPLVSGERLVLWWRYGMYANNQYFMSENDKGKVDACDVFSHVEKNQHNEYLLRLFTK